MVNNLESTQAAWDDSDWKENETEENSNKPEENSDWNKSPPSSPPLSRSSNSHSTPPPFNLFNNDIKNHFETRGIAITSCLKEVKFVYRNFILIFHPDKYNKKNPSLKKKEVQNINVYLIHTNPSSNLILYFSSQGNFLKKLVTSLSYCYIHTIDKSYLSLQCFHFTLGE